MARPVSPLGVAHEPDTLGVPSGLGDLVGLFREIGDLKRAHVAGRPGSIADHAFLRAWSALVAGEDLATVTASECAAAVAGARLAGLDGPVLRDDLARRRDFLCEGLDSVGLEVHVPQGTYFVTTDVSKVGHDDGVAFCADMADRAKVVAIPTQVFYEDGSEHGRHLVRWAFCKEQDLIVEGLRRLRATDLHRG